VEFFEDWEDLLRFETKLVLAFLDGNGIERELSQSVALRLLLPLLGLPTFNTFHLLTLQNLVV